VNLASRICAAADQILVDATVAAEVGNAFAPSPLGTDPLRGFAEDMPVFSVKRELPLATMIEERRQTMGDRWIT
jgi:class 3 adenylate cyclase